MPEVAPVTSRTHPSAQTQSNVGVSASKLLMPSWSDAWKQPIEEVRLIPSSQDEDSPLWLDGGAIEFESNGWMQPRKTPNNKFKFRPDEEPIPISIHHHSKASNQPQLQFQSSHNSHLSHSSLSYRSNDAVDECRFSPPDQLNQFYQTQNASNSILTSPTGSSVTASSTSTMSRASSIASSVSTQPIQTVHHTFVPLSTPAGPTVPSQLQSQTIASHEMSLLESMHELSIAGEEFEGEFDVTQPQPFHRGNRDDEKVNESEDHSADLVPDQDFMHDMSIDTMAQLHQHQNWTPFVKKRREQHTPASSSVPNSAHSNPTSAFHTPRARPFDNTGPVDMLDLSSITPIRPHSHHTPTRVVSHFTTPFSSRKSTSMLPPTESESNTFGPFTLPSEEECQAFFQTYRDSETPTRQPIKLYDPLTDTVVEHATTADIHVTTNEHRTECDEENHEHLLRSVHVSPVRTNTSHIAIPFGSPCSPLQVSHPNAAIPTTIALAADESSFSFSPAPKQSQLSTHSAMKTPSKPIHLLQVPPVSILKTPSVKKNATSIQTSPAMIFSPTNGHLQPPSHHHPLGSPFSNLMLSPVVHPSATRSSTNVSPLPPVTPATAKVVRFEGVPISQNSSIDASNSSEPVIHQYEDVSHPQQLEIHEVGTSELQSMNELSIFDATLLEMSQLRMNTFGRDQPLPSHVRVSSTFESAKPFMMEPSILNFSMGLIAPEVEQLPPQQQHRASSSTRLKHESTAIMSPTMNSFFVPFEALDRSQMNQTNEFGSTSLHHSSSSSDTSSTTTIAPFKIVVEEVSTPQLDRPNEQPVDASLFPESSFLSSSESDSNHEMSSISFVAPTRSAATPAFLRVPGKRGKISSNSASGSPQHRVSIKRKHVTTDRVIRTHARYHRKQRDPLTGTKKRSMRIFPNSVKEDLTRTLTFMSSASESDTPVRQPPQPHQTRAGAPTSTNTLPASKFEVEFSQPHFRSHPPPSPESPNSDSPSRKFLDFSDERLQADEHNSDISAELDSSLSQNAHDLSASRINLSETFEQMTVLENTPMRPTFANRSTNLDSQLTPLPPLSDVSPVSKPTIKKKVEIENEIPVTEFSPIRKFERYPPVEPIQFEEVATNLLPSSPTTAAPSPINATMYQQHRLKNKLPSYFRPSSIDYYGFMSRPSSSSYSPTLSQAHLVKSVLSPSPHPFQSGSEIPPSATNLNSQPIQELNPSQPSPSMFVPVQLYMCVTPAMVSNMAMNPTQFVVSPLAQPSMQPVSFSSPVSSASPTLPFMAHSPLTTIHPSRTVQATSSATFLPSPTLSAARHRLLRTLAGH